MVPYLERYSYQSTPGGPDEGATKTEDGQDGPLTKFKKLTLDIQNMTEPKKNMLNCEELFCIYLREVSTQVNETYYSRIMQFVLMFRDCLNMYGW